jgi:hypothetical protein
MVFEWTILASKAKFFLVFYNYFLPITLTGNTNQVAFYNYKKRLTQFPQKINQNKTSYFVSLSLKN